MNRPQADFYAFLGLHNILLGLFPFFIPVYLFKNGAGLAEIAWFISATGLGYCGALWLFDRLRIFSGRLPVIPSFICEGLLLFCLLGDLPLILSGWLNGVYAGLYWTIQRVLFLDGGSDHDSGRRFGNFQIYVLLVLKCGIFVGSLLLENGGLWAVGSVNLFVICAAVIWFTRRHGIGCPEAMQQQSSLLLRDVALFTDGCRSRLVFAVDGVFLYLESYFWLITLFLVVGESFVRLGLLVIGLAVILAIIFTIIKNRIDRVDTQRVYLLAVALYASSWVMRALLNEEMGQTGQLSLLLVIAFCTSFFRLSFNKRFFDNAKQGRRFHLLLIKSYHSQCTLALAFGLLALLLERVVGMSLEPNVVLKYCYMTAAPLAAIYFAYLPVKKRAVGQ